MALQILDRIRFRVYEDVFMPSRLGKYERLLQCFLDNEYEFVSVGNFAHRVGRGEPLKDRTVILRHDIDTDPETANAMHTIEKSLEIESSYFFRLSTMDFALMSDVSEAGGESSYHYEEIASVAKRRGLTSREEVLKFMPEIQELFYENLSRLRRESGLPMTTVASHGDFVNRIIGMANHELIDTELRRKLGILTEVYDKSLAEFLTARVTDCAHPVYWYPHSPLETIAEAKSVIYILVHPKHWYARISANLKELGTRIGDDLVYRWRSSR